jgi:hypothetical protein
MPFAHWNANARGEYWIDVVLGGLPLQVLVDTGLVDAKGQVGFSIDETLYDSMKQTGVFRSHQTYARMAATGTSG